MNRLKYFLAISTLMLLFSCQQEESNATKLQRIIENYEAHKGYDRKEHPLGLVTKEYYQAEAEFASSKLDELSKINSEDLSETEQISLELLKFKLQDIIDFYEFERYLNPLLSDSGFHSSLNYMVRPLANYEKTKEYLNKLNALPNYVDQSFVNLRQGLEKGVSQPLVIFKGYESTYDKHIVDRYDKSYFYSPFKNLPETLTTEQKDSVLTAARTAIDENVTPQFKRIKEFFEKEYYLKTRKTLGVSETPGGAAYYQNRINFYTTSTQYTADDIHQIGLNEVARIKAEMEKIIARFRI